MTPQNPLLDEWKTPYGLPPFGEVRAEHFEPAFDVALAEHNAEIERIAAQPQAPSFDNTVAAFDASGRLLTRIGRLFHNLCSSETSAELQAIERALAPRLATHYSHIYLNSRLFERVDALHARRETLGLPPESHRLLERVHLDFVLAGARLSGADRQRFAEIVERLAELQTAFSQNVLYDESSWALWLAEERDLAGLPPFVRASAREAAKQRGRPDAWAITLSRSLIVPFLTFADRRDLREQAFGRGCREANITANTTTARSPARSSRCARSRHG